MEVSPRLGVDRARAHPQRFHLATCASACAAVGRMGGAHPPIGAAMITRFVEVTNGPNNWGKFLIGKFEERERAYGSAVDEGRPLLRAIGFGPDLDAWVLVHDLQTREGGIFYLRGHAAADLNKTRVWVCPMFEPFLVWLYARYQAAASAGDREWWEGLPTHVDIPEAPFAMRGHRREGTR